MWQKISNSKWFERLFSAAIAIFIVFLGQGLIASRETNNRSQDKLEQQIKEKASVQDVDNLKVYVDQQDINLQKSVQQHIEESRETDQKEMELILSMDRKIDILLTRLNK